MGLPRLLKMQKVYRANKSYLGTLKTLTLPDWESETEDFQLPIGKFAMDTGLKQLVIKMKIAGDENLLRPAFMNPSLTQEGLYWVASYQKQNGGTATAEISAQGTCKKMGRGDQEVNKISEAEYEFHPTIYWEKEDGIETIYIDYLNNVLRIDGVDIMEQHRANVG